MIRLLGALGFKQLVQHDAIEFFDRVKCYFFDVPEFNLVNPFDIFCSEVKYVYTCLQ